MQLLSILAVTHEVDNFDDALRSLENRTVSWYELAKSIVERLVATMLLIILSPIIVFSLTLVRLTSSGPLISKHKRVGQNGSQFTMYKIRSIEVDRQTNRSCCSLLAERCATAIGRFLRRSQIDQFPQLINVIRGEMSLIGPHPERPELVAQFQRALPHYHLRHMVRPGVSGLAQVLQPPVTDLGSLCLRLKYDIHYVNRMNLFLDAQIYLATSLRCFGISRRQIAEWMGFPCEPARQ
jgi:lipopolysaccharide/colanic/teichoic acid biosynthesis glycosyltransferase